ncbi:hypothetical protein COLO4_17730 [Corchorus olitorius]|uniref:Uncharacterized protein n=1 Tax=Corchorus olitorius TaxID=93759 RepID=A0A1R3JBQ4_9ROSI|nr:hypothetical protein COLO4_17730 [Corchorus olitorius]
MANIISPSDKLYEAGPLFTNQANADGFKQATIPPTVTYRGYKLAAVDITFSHLGFAGGAEGRSEFWRAALTFGRKRNFGCEENLGLER